MPESFLSEEPQTFAPLEGRMFRCPSCNRFTRHSIYMEGNEKKVKCLECKEIQATLVPRGDGMWLDKRLAEHMGLLTLVIGGNATAQTALAYGMEDSTLRKSKKGWKPVIQPKDVTPKKARKRLNLTKALALPAIALGGLHLALTVLAVQYKLYLWPFTEVWSAFMWMGAETEVLAGILASSVAIALGILGILLRRKPK